MAGEFDKYVDVFRVVGFADLVDSVMMVIDTLRVTGRAQAAKLLEESLFRFETELQSISVTFAARATEIAIQEEESTRVRPDTGEPDIKRMTHYFQSDPLPGLPGWVGFIDQDRLEHSPAHWWWTQEKGYSGHVDRELHGWFFDSGWTGPSRPDPNEFQQHPLFGPTGEKGPPMTIHNPIHGRHFLESALTQIAPEWEAAVMLAYRTLEVDLAAVEAGSYEIIYAPIP